MHPAGLAEAAASGVLPPKPGRTTGRPAAARTGLREHALALVDAVIAFHQAEAADQSDWRLEVAHPTPAGSLVPDAVVLLDDGRGAFVEIDRTMSYNRLIAKLERYDAYRSAPRPDAATPPVPRVATGRRRMPGLPLNVPSRRCCSSSPPLRAARLRPLGKPSSTRVPVVFRAWTTGSSWRPRPWRG
ncbi:replication-relaxation family protein [Streptomyces sp. NPDC002573]|uniref:replication-relaxation family protein n=1 Tax=Streptomyces sp. NPDC002573 TaxID=3364651 RepID=UPI0036C22A2E